MTEEEKIRDLHSKMGPLCNGVEVEVILKTISILKTHCMIEIIKPEYLIEFLDFVYGIEKNAIEMFISSKEERKLQ